MEPISHRNHVAFLEKKLLQASRFLSFGKYSVRKLIKKNIKFDTKKKVIEDSKVFENRMDFWQKTVKYLYKDLKNSINGLMIRFG